MKKPTLVHPLMTEAFIIWLLSIGYRATVNQHGVRFFCEVVNKNFPRDVVIAETGRLNKPATQLFEEFKKYKPFGEVA
ncbi:hypothetical protein [Acinetobacter pseudolwoffii]|uniref:hypothetical protein n=1 Tax=Acinetobacter pseudolwoffii TaxID=2053287 RepID=UPI002469439C|nr:hypothetical protein [Acinetobacter pseudolwoffii]MDH5818970.1 hypothetical protein [Acinetobacter pseudolwoffii]MDH5819540.1 hypothetical protein [Acinetobacter pseudolwoffii]